MGCHEILKNTLIYGCFSFLKVSNVLCLYVYTDVKSVNICMVMVSFQNLFP